MSGTDVHPTDEALQAFTLGTLDGACGASVENHLTDCPSCQARAAGAPADTLVELLRSAHARPGVSENTPAPSVITATMLWSPTDLSAPSGPAELAGHARYRLLRQLGAGGMGAVWLAEHSVMGRQVALKVIRPEHLARLGAAERFRREVQAAASLHHPNIVTAHDADQAGATHFLVMEYVEGVSLAEHLERTGPLPVAEACRLARDAALGLQHAHEHGLIHRDVKPHNIMLTADGGVKILDFGLAALAAGSDEAARLTGANMVVGTPDYIAPEQAEDAHRADIRSDVYSLGCTLYQMLAGRVPFPDGSVLRKLDAHRTRPPEPIRSLRLDVPLALALVLAKMMAKDPAGRYQTPAEVAAALGPFVRGGAARPRRRWPLVAAAAVLFAGLTAAAVGVYRVQTDNGELVITTESDDVEVVIKQNGKEVRVIDTKTDKSITLHSGVYELELKDAGEGLKLNIDKATLTRGVTVLAKIERTLKPAGQAQSQPAVEELEKLQGTWTLFSFEVEGVQVTDRDKRETFTFKEDTWIMKVGDHVESGTIKFVTAPNGFDLLHTGEKYKGLTTHAIFQVDGDTMKYCAPGRDFQQALPRPTSFTTKAGEPGFLAVYKRVASVLPKAVPSEKVGEVRRFEGHNRNIAPRVLSSDGRLMATGDYNEGQEDERAKSFVRIWDVQTGKELRRLGGLSGSVMQLVFSPDGKCLLSGGNADYATLRLWDVTTGKEVQRFEGHSDYVTGLAFLPDGKRILSCSYDRTLRLWDLATGKELKQIEGHAGRVRGMALSPDGRHVLAVDDDEPICLWDLETGKEIRRFEGHKGGNDVPVFVPDGRRFLASGVDNTIWLWDVETGKVVRSFTGHTSGCGAFVFSADGRLFLSASGGDQSIRWWGIDSGKELQRYDIPTTVLTPFISADGRYAVSGGGADKILRLWRLPDPPASKDQP